MRIRILSDLHLDINEGLQFSLKDTKTFTVICGDISGYFTITSKWLNRYIKNGVLWPVITLYIMNTITLFSIFVNN